jgi:predicted Rossmann-fold nucleotide-binding protein
MKMNELWCDCLPGGFGTLEELFEMLTWAIRDFIKPIAILNTNGFYDALIVLLNNMVDNGF